MSRKPLTWAAPAPPPRTADELAELRQFARCLRESGIADYPDPRESTGASR